jgi:hypothetical protein
LTQVKTPRSTAQAHSHFPKALLHSVLQAPLQGNFAITQPRALLRYTQVLVGSLSVTKQLTTRQVIWLLLAAEGACLAAVAAVLAAI